MKLKKVILFLTSILSILIFAACASGNGLGGSRWHLSGLGIYLDFFENGSGIETVDGASYHFEWQADNGSLSINFVQDNLDTSFINDVLVSAGHGIAATALSYIISIEGNYLILTDDHGHGHFRHVLERIN